MCEISAERLIAEFKRTAETFKPASVLQWNGMSWDYLSIALAAPDVPKEDRKGLVEFARKAMVAAACFQLGLGALPKALRWRRRDRVNALVEAMASLKMPPEPGPTGSQTIDFGEGPMTIESVPEDKYRIERRRAIAAALLLRIEKNTDWKPTPAEFEEISLKAGARVRQSA